MILGTCPTGYITDDFDCIDENECVANNGHGPCQDTCTNTHGGYQEQTFKTFQDFHEYTITIKVDIELFKTSDIIPALSSEMC